MDSTKTNKLQNITLERLYTDLNKTTDTKKKAIINRLIKIKETQLYKNFDSIFDNEQYDQVVPTPKIKTTSDISNDVMMRRLDANIYIKNKTNFIKPYEE